VEKERENRSIRLSIACACIAYLGFALPVANAGDQAALSNAATEEANQTKALLAKLARYNEAELSDPAIAELENKLQQALESKRQLQAQQESFVSEILRLKQKIRETAVQTPEAADEAFAKREKDLLEQLRQERELAEKFRRSSGDSEEQTRELQRTESKSKRFAAELSVLQHDLNKKNEKLAESNARITELEQGNVKSSEVRDSLIKARQAAQRFEVQLERMKQIESDNEFLRSELSKAKQTLAVYAEKNAVVAKVNQKLSDARTEQEKLQSSLTEREAKLEKYERTLGEVARMNNAHEAIVAEKDEELLSLKRQLSKVIEETRVCSLTVDETNQEIAEIPAIRSKLEETVARLSASEAGMKECLGSLEASKDLIAKRGKIEKELITAKNELLLKDTEVELLTKSAAGTPADVKRMLTELRASRGALQERSQEESGRGRLAATETVARTVSNTAPLADVVLLEVIGPKVNLRSGPGEEHSPIMQVQEGTRLTVEDRTGDWYRVFTPTGARAFIRDDLVKVIDNGRSAAPQVVSAPSAPRGPQQPVARADHELVPFGKVKIAGRTPEPRDAEARALEQLRAGFNSRSQPNQ
jgi:hypothetical protein